MDDSLHLHKALHFLRTQQQTDGSFLSDSSPQAVPFTSDHQYQTVFAPALILQALSAVPQAGDIQQKIADFLITQKSAHWSFNYWARQSNEAKSMPYPDDLDDTFCALNALWLHDPSRITGAALAHITKILITTEESVGGPYHTWLVPKDSPAVWRDTDLAVNANIALFLQLAVQPLPNLTTFMEEAIASCSFQSPYYPDMYPIIYYLSRAYRGPQRPALVEFINNRCLPDGRWDTPLHTALAICSLRNLEQPLPAAAQQYLMQTQQQNGSWPAEAFSIDPKRQGRVYYGGSAALTTAFCIEALYAPHRSSAKPHSTTKPSIYATTITDRAAQDCRSLDGAVRDPLLAALASAAHGKNGQEIICLASHFYKNLPHSPILEQATLDALALANLYGWTAYTLYDDILDGDAEVAVLPAANVAMRRSMHWFLQAVPNSPAFHAHVRTTFDAMDAANAWEITQGRFAIKDTHITIGTLPSYGKGQQLAQRSLGHTLAPLGVFAAGGVVPHAAAAQKLQTPLTHYLIAKQLNDDIHDWEDDLRAGHSTFVVTHILRSLKITPGQYDINQLIAQATPHFWHHILPQMCDTIAHHIAQSREALAAVSPLASKNVVTSLLDTLDQVMATTRATITQTEEFLKAYRSAP